MKRIHHTGAAVLLLTGCLVILPLHAAAQGQAPTGGAASNTSSSAAPGPGEPPAPAVANPPATMPSPPLPVTLPVPPPAPGPAARTNLLNLSAQATIEVANDVMTITYSATREGTDAQVVQTLIKQALDTALAEARRAARPGLIDVETGNFSLYPRYTPPGWQGRADLLTTGKDLQGIARLAGRINTMSVTRVVHSLSREAREKAEAEATAQAVAKFRSRAAELARLFSFADYLIREVNVSTSESGGEAPVIRARMSASNAAMGEAALPAEAGRGTVTVVVSGSVEMR